MPIICFATARRGGEKRRVGFYGRRHESGREGTDAPLVANGAFP